MSASLAYRTNEPAILAGSPPEKYLRLLPHIPGQAILEIGSAEGVLACLLARRDGGNKREVTALERNRERHDAACRLYDSWRARFRLTGMSHFITGDIADRLELLDGKDTLVAVRMIYYLGAQLDTVFAAAAAAGVVNIVLCGNRNRAARWRAGEPNDHDRADNYYASEEGMADLLTRHGYEIVTRVTAGDPILVGRRRV
jgi:hypothetical protein